jgi:L-fuconolactonase
MERGCFSNSLTESSLQRRDLLKLVVGSAAELALQPGLHALPKATPILDAHIHLFDTSRPGGVPWPEKTDAAIYKPALPERLIKLAAPFGVVGAIAIEASPLKSDNDWLLQVAAGNPFIVGVVGDLIPDSPSYMSDLDRLRANPLFLGIRYGNIWDRDLLVDMERPGFIEGLKALAHAGLAFDSANPDPKLIRAILHVAQRVPELRIVIDHLPHAPIPSEPEARKEYSSNLEELAARPGVFVKLSEVPVLSNGKLVTDPQAYKASLDLIWDTFGEDRILFGSDWPNSDHVAPYQDTIAIVKRYISTKSVAAQEKYFWKNSVAAYKWHSRLPSQPSA